jgi:hypothetical protein
VEHIIFEDVCICVSARMHKADTEKRKHHFARDLHPQPSCFEPITEIQDQFHHHENALTSPTKQLISADKKCK